MKNYPWIVIIRKRTWRVAEPIFSLLLVLLLLFLNSLPLFFVESILKRLVLLFLKKKKKQHLLHCLSYFSICRIWLLPWKRAEHGSPFLSRLSDDIFSTKAKRQKKTSFSSRGMRGKSNPFTPLAPNASVAPGGWPRDSAGQPWCAALSLRRSHPPPSPRLRHPHLSPLGKKSAGFKPRFSHSFSA